MDQKEITTLRFIEALEKKQTQSQRELSNNLNISLGLVNSFVKRLIRKGYFKITSIPKKRFMYALTPKGFAKKANLTSKYILYSISFYKEIQSRISTVFKELSEDGIVNTVWFGAGELSEIAYSIIRSTDLKIIKLIDPKRAGKNFFGHRIVDMSVLKDIEYDAVLIMEIENNETIKTLLIESGVPKEKIKLLTGDPIVE